MAWDGVVRIRPATLGHLAARYGGEVRGGTRPGLGPELGRFVPLERAGAGDLAPLLARRFARAAALAVSRGASLLIDAALTEHPDIARLPGWVHPYGAWAMAEVLDRRAQVPAIEATHDEGFTTGANVTWGPRVVFGARVHVGSSSVIGRMGFGWAKGPNGRARQMPHLGGVIVEDDVYIGSLCTIDAGVLSPTRIRRGAKLDAQVHVAHNCDVGEGTMIAAQSGLAGSVKVGKGVLIGGQVGVADHVTIGDGARIAAKSGVIADVPPGETVAGYPAVPRGRWLRGLATLYRGLREGRRRP